MGGQAKNPFPTYELLECIDAAEYNALTEGNKERIRLVISCGVINTTGGNKLLDMVKNIFPVGTTTRTALDALLSYTPPGP